MQEVVGRGTGRARGPRCHTQFPAGSGAVSSAPVVPVGLGLGVCGCSFPLCVWGGFFSFFCCGFIVSSTPASMRCGAPFAPVPRSPPPAPGAIPPAFCLQQRRILFIGTRPDDASPQSCPMLGIRVEPDYLIPRVPNQREGAQRRTCVIPTRVNARISSYNHSIPAPSGGAPVNTV